MQYIDSGFAGRYVRIFSLQQFGFVVQQRSQTRLLG